MSYRTTELELASFLRAKGHRVQEAIPQGRLVALVFDGEVATDVSAYFAGEQISAQELFGAHRSLRALIQQVKEHQYNTKDQNRYEYSSNRS